MTKYGLQIASEGSNIDEGELKYDSGLGHLSVDLFADPKHFDIIRVVGTDIPIDTASRYEVLIKIKHGKPFVPKIDCYFYLDKEHTDVSVMPSGYMYAESFNRNFFPLINLGGPVFDGYVVSVDETNLEIGHYSQSSGYVSTSNASKLPAFCKYYIYDVEGYIRSGVTNPLGYSY
jgi:hypothetical protein